MGFYGKITNTARTQFQFDKVYSNRRAMDHACLSDGIYLGRFVLVEYSEKNLDDHTRVWKYENALYTSGDTFGYDTKLKVDGTHIKVNDFVYEILSGEGTKSERHIFYQITGKGADNVAIYKEVIDDGGDSYVANYNIDRLIYGAGRGFDSTVWQKVYTDTKEKYVMIAELNTVVPTFEIAPDAPTMTPIVPHFDTQSTDVYYKLHWQTPWGFRVAAADNSDQSDAKTSWVKYKYNVETGVTIPQCYDPEHAEADEYGWRNQTSAEINNLTQLPRHDAAIYFNWAAFDPNSTSAKRIDDYKAEDNFIKITPTGISGEKYNKHDGSLGMDAMPDTQEITIHLPEIGNMMSDAWDIIHGPNRDNARTNENGSLQGRLDSFKEIKENQIPVKRAEDGTLIGSKINNALKYEEWEAKPVEILEDDGITPEFVRDDAWIETVINTSGLVGGIKDGDSIDQSGNSGISIHHTFHATKNSVTELDKNSGNFTSSNTYKEAYLKSSNKDHNHDDKLDLYVPYVDAKGHVVGQNIETVTLPYGYKHIMTNALNKEDTVHEAFKDENTLTKNFSATSTQSHLQINTGNKWIGVYMERITDDNNQIVDSISLDHMLTTIDDEDSDGTDLNNTEGTINIPDWDCDKAGHIISKKKHEYVLPYGYSVIEGDNVGSKAIATKVNDTLKFASDSWLAVNIVPNEKKVSISHSNPIKPSVQVASPQPQTPEFGDSFTLAAYYFDNKGHMVSETSKNLEYKITIPKGSLTDDKANGADVITQLSFVDTAGALSTTRVNISQLLLTDYSKMNNNEDVKADDKLGEALSKLQTQIHEEETNRLNAINNEEYARIVADTALRNDLTAEIQNREDADTLLRTNLDIEINRAKMAEAQVLADAQAYADGVKKAILTGDSTDNLNAAYDTLLEISNWINGDGVNTVELTSAIATETQKRETADQDINNKINILNNTVSGLKSAAYREEMYFVSKEEYDLALSAKDAQIAGLNFEAKRLTNEVNELTTLVQQLSERIAALENQNGLTE